MASIAIIFGSLAYPFGSFSHPGPAFLPLSSGIVMAGMSLILFVQAMLKNHKREEQKGEAFLTKRWPKLVATLLILIAYSFLLNYLGYPLTTFIFMLLTLKVVEPKNWRTALLESTLAVIISYTLFEVILKVYLPKGSLLKLIF
jgi:putative tricarboxylic transport membrane protein